MKLPTTPSNIEGIPARLSATTLPCLLAIEPRGANAFLPDVARTLDNLGIVYENIKNYSKAEHSFNEALEIRRKLVAQNPNAFSPNLASTLSNLGLFYSRSQKLGKAESSNDFKGVSSKNSPTGGNSVQVG